MEHARVGMIDTKAGDENADPVAPLVGAGYLEIAQVMLTPGGIEAVTMNTANQIVSAQQLDQRTAQLEVFRDRTGPQVQSLAADIAALSKGQTGVVTFDQYGRTLTRLAELEARAGIPQEALDSAADYFLDLRATDPAFGGFLAKTEEGIRFADEAADIKPLQIFNPLNAAAKIVDGVMFPAFTLEKRFSVGKPTGEVQCAQYSYQTNELVQKTVSRIRIRYGASKTVCTNSAWWQSGSTIPSRTSFAPTAKRGNWPRKTTPTPPATPSSA